MHSNNQIVIYQSEDGQTQVDVRLENETVWLTQQQIAELFNTKRPAITKHLKNIYTSKELDENSTCSILEHMGNEGKQTYSTKYYNLDAIISVGYRVNSKNATRFRQWANTVLKQYLIKGYAINERMRKEQIGELRQLVGMLGRTIQNQPLLSNDETDALFKVVTDYTYALDTLDNYDYGRLTINKTTEEEPFHATYDNAMGQSKGCATNLAALFSLEMRKTALSKAVSGRYTRPLAEKNSTPVWRRKQPCFSILLPRTTRSAMAINALPPRCFFGFSTATISSIILTAASA